MNFYLVEIEAFNHDTTDTHNIYMVVVAESYYHAVDKTCEVEEESNEEILSMKITQINDETIEQGYIYISDELYTKFREI